MNINKDKQFKKLMQPSWLVMSLFISIFVLSQIVSLVHITSHQTHDTDKFCLYCLNTTNDIIEADIKPAILFSNEIYFEFNQTLALFIATPHINYSSRAPPIC